MKAINKIKLVIVGMIIIGLAVLCPFASHPFASQASEVDSIEIIDFGLYQTTFAQWEQAPNTQRGEIQLVGSRELIRRTKRIPGKGGTEFGIRYVVNGQEEGGQVDLLVKVLHAETQSSDEWTTSRQIGAPSFDGWKLGADSELVPGKLTIQLFHQGMKLAEKSFTVFSFA
jgi:hypothetical protein